MKMKYSIVPICLMLSLVLTSCSQKKDSSDKSEYSSSNIVDTSSTTKNELTKKVIDDLIGEWRSIEDNSNLTIEKDGSSFTIVFSDPDINDMTNASGTQTSPTLFGFTSLDGNSIYSFAFLENDSLLFYFSPTDPEQIGMSKPIEFKRAN